MPINSVFQRSDLYCRKMLIFVRILACINRMWLLLLKSCKYSSFLLGISIILYLYSWQSERESCLCKHPYSKWCFKGLHSTRVCWAKLSEQCGVVLAGVPLRTGGGELTSIPFSLPEPIGKSCFILAGKTDCTYTQRWHCTKLCWRPDDNVPKTV